jgi:hypothetical protein
VRAVAINAVQVTIQIIEPVYISQPGYKGRRMREVPPRIVPLIAAMGDTESNNCWPVGSNGDRG